MNTDTRNYDEATLAQINTVGRYLGAFDGDIPFAMACTLTCAKRKAKKYQKMVVHYTLKVISAKKVEERLADLGVACRAWHRAMSHDDWLFAHWWRTARVPTEHRLRKRWL